MALLKVARLGHPVLRKKAREVDPDRIADPEFQRLIDDMIETMVDEVGIGLAAPQVFRSLRLIVLGEPDADSKDPDAIPLTVLINPVWLERSEETTEAWEACLSIRGLHGPVPRSVRVGVEFLDRKGERRELHVTDLFARVLQHEVDHLDGILYLDRMTDLRRLSFTEEFRRYWQTQVG